MTGKVSLYSSMFLGLKLHKKVEEKEINCMLQGVLYVPWIFEFVTGLCLKLNFN